MHKYHRQDRRVTGFPGVTVHRVGDLQIRSGCLDSMVRMIKSWFDSEKRVSRSVGFINPHVFNQAACHPGVLHFISSCDLVCVDGVGMSVGLRIFLGIRTKRVVATKLFDAILSQSGIQARAILIGVSDDEVRRAAQAMNRASAGLKIVDAMNGYRSDSEYAETFRAYRDIDMVLIGAGSPRSENIGRLASRICNSTVFYHIGAGTIKIYAGTKRRAPAWLSRMGCEWLHRIVFEPHTRTRYFIGSIQCIQNLANFAAKGRQEKSAL